ncbi:MAG: recombinase RecA [Anaerolineae bacterium]|nr:recombinase RecA [Anaerolineae bacterium]
MSDNGRDKALETALASLTKRFGEGAIMRLGEATHLHVETIPTGALSLDRALGAGGVPRGRVTEIYGPEGAGKTTLCQHIVAEAQKRGGTAAFIDMEHALDPAYAALCGVDVDDLLISQPDTGEQALEIAETLIRSGAIDIVAIDSVAALVPRAEIEGEMGDSHPGLQARLMSQALRKLSGAVKQSNTALVFTNQLREKIGVMFGNPETTSGGRALKFYATVRLDIRRINAIKEKGEVIGNRTRVRVTKNKVAPPFRVAEFDIMYDEGISRSGDLLDIATELEVVEKRGSYYYRDGESLAQGRENAKQYLRDNPEVADQLEALVRAQLALEGAPPLLEDDGHLEEDEEPEVEMLSQSEDEDSEEASLEGEMPETEELEAEPEAVAEPA